MTRKLPIINGRAVVSALRCAGFHVHHVKGSHDVLRHPNEPTLQVVVPVHRKDLPHDTLRSIIKQAGLTVGEFLDFL